MTQRGEHFKVTEEVVMTGDLTYLIRIDGEEMAVSTDFEEAKMIIDSLANAEMKRLRNDWTQVFRHNENDDKKVIVSSQALGYVVNGSVYPTTTIDIVTVGRARFARKVPTPPPMPTPEQLKSRPFTYGVPSAEDLKKNKPSTINKFSDFLNITEKDICV
jgi:hypothetical protein